MCESRRSSACFGLNWEGVNGSLLQKIFIIWGKYRKLQKNFRFPWGIFYILIYAQDLSGLFGTHKSNAVDGCRQKQSIDWTEHISKQDNVSLDFCGKTDGGRLYLSSLLHIQHCTPFLRNQQSWRGVVSAPFCYHMTRGEENICAYTQQNWRSKIDPCTKMSNHSWATWKSWPVQPAV